MSITNKEEALLHIDTEIVSSTDGNSNLKPTNSPIKYTNFSNFWKDFINYLFPTPLSDLYGKTPIFGVNTSTTNYMLPNTNYSRLKYQAIVPIGGIIMCGEKGDNYGTPNSGTPIEGYLYCDGSVIDMSLTVNKKYEKLQNIIGKSFYNHKNPLHNPQNLPSTTPPASNLMYLPDFRSKTPVGYNINGDNIGKTGGANTYKITQNDLPAIPNHQHGLVANTNPVLGHSLNITAETMDNTVKHSHDLWYDNINTADTSVRIIGTRNTASRQYDKNTIGEYWRGIRVDENYHVLYSRTHDNGAHIHNVTMSGVLSGSTGFVVPYDKTATPINMRSAYLVTNFIIKY